MLAPLTSIPDIVEIHPVRGASADPDAGPDLVIEIPHGATATADYQAVADRLTSPLPAGLVDFFHVNTDAGAPELGLATARRLVRDRPSLVVAIVRCRIPRTFIDCNRKIDAAPEDFRAGKVTPGLMPWITSPEDRALLRSRYDAYLAAVAATLDRLGPSGALLLLHTYAPRTVDVAVDPEIVRSLRQAYQPEVIETWPLRPALDVIGRALDGTDHTPARVVATLRAELAVLGLEVADSATYPLHPSTLAYHQVLARPGRTLCLEVRRDLLADPFTPFAQMAIGADRVDRLAGPLATALGRWW